MSPRDARRRLTGGPAAPTLASEGIVGLFTETANAAFRTNDRGETLFHAPLFHFRRRRAYVVRSEEDAGRIRRKLRAFPPACS